MKKIRMKAVKIQIFNKLEDIHKNVNLLNNLNLMIILITILTNKVRNLAKFKKNHHHQMKVIKMKILAYNRR
jgi:hypothetical protein